MSGDPPSGNGRAFLPRLVALETWREDTDHWRLKLTGYDDSNGRLGRIDRAIEKLREDVGAPEECRQVRETVSDVRGIKTKLMASIGAALLAIGGSAYGLFKSRDENIAAAARQAARLDRLEADVARNRAVLDRLQYRWPVVTPLHDQPDQ